MIAISSVAVRAKFTRDPSGGSVVCAAAGSGKNGLKSSAGPTVANIQPSKAMNFRQLMRFIAPWQNFRPRLVADRAAF